MNGNVLWMDELAQNIADGRTSLGPEAYGKFWHDLSRAGDFVFGNDQTQAARELDYLRLRIPEARKAETQRRKAEDKAVGVVREYERQLAENGNDDAATVATAEALGMSVRSVYRAREQVGIKTVVGIGTGRAHSRD